MILLTICKNIVVWILLLPRICKVNVEERSKSELIISSKSNGGHNYELWCARDSVSLLIKKFEFKF